VRTLSSAMRRFPSIMPASAASKEAMWGTQPRGGEGKREREKNGEGKNEGRRKKGMKEEERREGGRKEGRENNGREGGR